jgi:hypothetical protein
MKRGPSSRRGSRISRRGLKAEIVRKVREGVFDRNPLLATPHTVECKSCGCSQKIVYLSYLRSGRFELGKTKVVEVAYAAPTLLGLNYIPESVTPILIQVRCKGCGTEISCCPASLEYLMFTARRQVRSDQIYIE